MRVANIVAALLSIVSASAMAAAEAFIIDGEHTFPMFAYNHHDYAVQFGKFDKTTGTIIIDRELKTGSARVFIETESINTGSKKLNDVLQGPDFFNAKRYPKILFMSDAIKFDGSSPSAMEGMLSMNGYTKPVTINITQFNCKPHPISKKDACGANANASIKRSDFGLDKYAPDIGDEVSLTISIEAIKQE